MSIDPPKDLMILAIDTNSDEANSLSGDKIFHMSS